MSEQTDRWDQVISSWASMSDKKREHFCKSIRMLALERKRQTKILEEISKKKDLSPIGFQKAFEKAIENKAAVWKEFRNARSIQLRMCEEHLQERRSLAQSLWSAKRRLKNLENEIKEKLFLTNLKLAVDGMPEIPLPEKTASEWALVQKRIAGVYIAFFRGVVRYVGESCNIPGRLKSHEKVREDWFVSVIEMEPKERFFAECYYIWLLKPPLNKEGMRTIEASNK